MIYDFIVAGGGSSGCLVAGKLAKEHGARVLVLEAGGNDDSPLIRMPAGFVKLLGVEKYMWFYKSTVQQRLNSREPVVPQGRVIGGGSSVNAMVYIRGQASDYEPWVEATGDEQWSFRSLLAYFKRMEGNNRYNNELHGINGPLKVSDPRQICDLSRIYVQAAQAIGVPFNPDFNGPRQAGTGFFQLTVDNGERCSASKAFLRPALSTGRVDVRTGALVHRVLIENGRAVGVAFSHGSVLHEARCEREVLLAAGAIATPKLLMLSGIGPHFHLKENGIKTLVDLEGVGQNLQDHTEVPVLAFCKGEQGYYGQDRGINQIRNGLQYMLFKSGPVSSNGVEACSFFDPDDLTAEAKIQQFCVPSVYLDSDVSSIRPQHGLTLNSCVLRPGSRGSVRLSSGNPGDQPLVDTNYFEDPEDLRLSLAGLRRAREILGSEPLRSVIEREVFPGPGITSREDLETFAKAYVKTVYHPVGTCRMGKSTDESAVVTPDLRVKGVEGLRVVDASVMPRIISGNTNSTTLVIADKAVDFITGQRLVA